MNAEGMFNVQFSMLNSQVKDYKVVKLICHLERSERSKITLTELHFLSTIFKIPLFVRNDKK